MKQMFGGRYAPVTFGCAFLRVPFLAIIDDYAGWTKKNYPHAAVEPLVCSFHEALEKLAPLTAPASKELLIGAGPEWTALFSNGLSSDAFSRAPYWSSRLGIDALAMDCIPDKKDQPASGAYGKYRAMQIQMFSGSAPLNEPRRTLSTLHDGNRWAFINQGEPFPFENSAKYTAKAVRDRLSIDDVEAFFLNFGLPASESEFSGPAAIVATNSASIRRSFSYQEAQVNQAIVVTQERERP